MNEQEKEALREMRSQIDEMLSEPKEGSDVVLCRWGDYRLLKDRSFNYRVERYDYRDAQRQDPRTSGHLLLQWLGQYADSHQPRVYREGDELPERLLKWDGGTWISSNKIFLEPGQTWCPLPPDYEASDD